MTDTCPECDEPCYSEWLDTGDRWTDARRYYCDVCGIVDREYDSLALDMAIEERSGLWPDE